MYEGSCSTLLPNPALVADLQAHSDALFADARGVRPTPVDADAVAQASVLAALLRSARAGSAVSL